MAPKFPLIELDTTLFDLYSIDGGNPDEVAHVIALAPPFGSVSSSLPENLKYTYQSPTAPKLADGVYARICLGNGSQNHGIMSGRMELYLFDIDPSEHDVINGLTETPAAHQTDAQRVYDCLIPSQRPKLEFISDPSNFKPNPGVRISPYPPLDFLDNHPCIIPQEVHYQLLSKRDLALSNLPTPQTDIIDGSLLPHDVENDQTVERESKRIIDAVRAKAPPFVIKFPQSLSGQGVFVVRDEIVKAKRIRILEEEVPRMIRSLNRENASMKPVSLLLQQLIDGDTNNLSLFITKNGRPICLSCAEQYLDEDGLYRGSIIDYQRQSELESRFKATIDKIAAHVHKRGFYGPMGGDIMTDSEGNQYVVDLNVRITGDYMMGALKGHFFERRGLAYSYVITPLVLLTCRDEFEENFRQEFQEGRLIIIGWVRGKGGNSGAHEYSVCSVAVGGEDKASMMALVDEINGLSLAKPS